MIVLYCGLLTYSGKLPENDTTENAISAFVLILIITAIILMIIAIYWSLQSKIVEKFRKKPRKSTEVEVVEQLFPESFIMLKKLFGRAEESAYFKFVEDCKIVLDQIRSKKNDDSNIHIKFDQHEQL